MISAAPLQVSPLPPIIPAGDIGVTCQKNQALLAQGLRSVTCHTGLEDSTSLGARFAQCVNGTPRILIPVDLEEKKAFIQKLLEDAETIPSRVALLLAAAKADHFAGNPAGWAQWAEDLYPANAGKGKYHLCKIGNMLLQLLRGGYEAIFDRLIRLETRKLYMISALNVDSVEKFLKVYKPETMSREEVAATINKILGKAVKTSVKQEALPGWEKALEALYQADEEDWKLLGKTKNEDLAERTVNASMGISKAAVESIITNEIEDIPFILQLENHLREEAERLRKYREKTTAKLFEQENSQGEHT